MPQFQLTRIIQEAVLEGRKPAKVIAKEIGKPYSTLLREVNPFDTSAKIGVETVLDIMTATGNVQPLEYMARQMGYQLTPLEEKAPEAPSRRTQNLSVSIPAGFIA
ncbi:MAG: phage regulatory CII family protein [Desulfovibrionaceae bacterium]